MRVPPLCKFVAPAVRVPTPAVPGEIDPETVSESLTVPEPESVAPELTVTALPVLVEPVKFKVPPAIVVVPVKSWVFDKVKVPLPALTKDNLPPAAPSLNLPAKVVLPGALEVNVAAVRLLF